MKFELIDQIVDLEPGKRIQTTKNVSLAEEYLGDHFPTFPILPGVLMLEALVQSGAWLVRATQDFSRSLILLRDARNVTYKSFVKPGFQMQIDVTCKKLGDDESDFMGVGRCGDNEVVKARFGLRHFNLEDRNPALKNVDERLVSAARGRYTILLDRHGRQKQQ